MNVVAPSGIVTFLFTDIEGSTRRWEADPDAMKAALAVHDDLMREAVAEHGGWLFKHTGDGVCAAFASPRSAVDAAVAAQRALELPVRMGISTGEAELRGEDYFGAVLNRTARVMAAGHGGQILLDGVAGALLTGVDLIPLGQRRLRDIANPVDVMQVAAPGLHRDFPPLRTATPTPGNLRQPSSSFVGRDAELVELGTVLTKHRLVTLTGVGGAGKTRLAIEVASRSARRYSDGVFIIELAAVSDPVAVPEAVAAVLGIVQQPDMDMTESVAHAQDGRSRLLVFDNCEHVLDAAANMIGAILVRSQSVTVIATSREGLRLDDELLWPVPSLDLSAGLESAAAQLFVERASNVARDISPSDDADSIVEICRRLDGIPLAIELAAFRMVSMNASELRTHLDDRFRLLTGARRGLERHQTLRHAVQWSYDLLDSAEKDLLTRCSVFAGGFDLAAAVAVSSNDELTTLDLLDALVRKSLLVADRSSARTRFSMLETIRQFAEEQLVAAANPDAVRTAHSQYFAGCEDDILSLWDSPRQREAYSWLAVELANLRAAFGWAADRGDLDGAAAIAHYAGFVGFWGDQYEPIRWADELTEPAGAVQHRRLAQLYAVAALCHHTGRIEDGISYATAGQKAITSGRFDGVREELEPLLGSIYLSTGEPARWVEWCRNVVTRHPDSHAHTQACLAMALEYAGENDEAMAASEELVALADATDNPNTASWCLYTYSTIRAGSAPDAAFGNLRRGLTIARDGGCRQIESPIAAQLSRLAARHGKFVDALDYIRLSIRYQYDSGGVYQMKAPLAVLVLLFYRLGDYQTAATIAGFVATEYTSTSVPGTATTLERLRDVLGDGAYESLARRGEEMTAAAIANYAFDQIDRARSQLSSTGAPK